MLGNRAVGRLIQAGKDPGRGGRRGCGGIGLGLEWQVRPISGGSWMDEPWNFEMLDASSNSSAGPRLRGNISRERERLAGATGDSTWRTRDICFTKVDAEGASPASRWVFEEITTGQHFVAYEELIGERKDKDV